MNKKSFLLLLIVISLGMLLLGIKIGSVHISIRDFVQRASRKDGF
jgi:Ca2+-dependent lipid-binding protein